MSNSFGKLHGKIVSSINFFFGNSFQKDVTFHFFQHHNVHTLEIVREYTLSLKKTEAFFKIIFFLFTLNGLTCVSCIKSILHYRLFEHWALYQHVVVMFLLSWQSFTVNHSKSSVIELDQIQCIGITRHFSI